MSKAPWATTALGKPYGFRVTIERTVKGAREFITFRSKVSSRAAAVQAAGYKQGFVRLVACFALTKEEWEREFGGSSTKAAKVTTS
jgi:hypothetical protein